MLFAEVIRKKRDGVDLSADEIRFFVAGLTDASIPAEQVSALAMAVFLKGMTFEETATLTQEMAASGVQLDWQSEHLPGPLVDKHSTGGVGDKVSFLLAPIAAACGCYIPMISGRGLGHSGGTLDKIECIPGYRSVPSLATFKAVVKEVGCAIIGQTNDLAPADRRFYAIRDTTATVESIALITASILSKKIAAGNEALVMDVKVGSGAFMNRLEDAEALAQSIINTAKLADLPVHALITDMNQCLGFTAGNALEVRECVDFLTGVRQESRLKQVTLALCAEMLLVTGQETNPETALNRVTRVLDSGHAAEIFSRMVTALGGPSDLLEHVDRILPAAPVVMPVYPNEAGFVSAVNARALGNLVIELGGGRRRLEDKLDLSVGLAEVSACGSWVDQANPVALVHARTEADCQQAARSLLAACKLTEAKPEQTSVIHEILPARDSQ